MKNNFSENLKRLMFEKALTQESLAKKLNLDQSRISRWKTGESVPSAKNLKKLASLLGVSTSDLVNNIKSNDRKDIDKKVESLEKIIKEMNKRIQVLEKEILKK